MLSLSEDYIEHKLTAREREREREREAGARDGGKGHREDDRSRPRLGSNKRLDAPRHTHLGSNPEKFPSPKHDPQQIPLHPPEVVESPPDLAVLSPFLAESISLRYFLRHSQRHPHFAGRSGDQCDDVRRHRRVRDALGGGDPCWVGFGWTLYVDSRTLALTYCDSSSRIPSSHRWHRQCIKRDFSRIIKKMNKAMNRARELAILTPMKNSLLWR
ncbi:unnamed protein product [Camellia sinensis]